VGFKGFGNSFPSIKVCTRRKNSLKIPVTLTTFGRNKITTKNRSQILVVSFCMLSVIRPDFEVVKEGRILNFLSGYRRFVVNEHNVE